ncbi:hypothetical protein Scep_003024 [Stephania cephalantha]|uniref:Uncharacterized protein n=1 Tax=Stephania cephalantha TaxID=152367 RepID=A0AAP0LB35_9MAGN
MSASVNFDFIKKYLSVDLSYGYRCGQAQQVSYLKRRFSSIILISKWDELGGFDCDLSCFI